MPHNDVPIYDGAKVRLTGEAAAADDKLLDAPGDEGAPVSLDQSEATAYNERVLGGKTGDDATDRTEEISGSIGSGALKRLTVGGLDSSPSTADALKSALPDPTSGSGSSTSSSSGSTASTTTSSGPVATSSGGMGVAALALVGVVVALIVGVFS